MINDFQYLIFATLIIQFVSAKNISDTAPCVNVPTSHELSNKPFTIGAQSFNTMDEVWKDIPEYEGIYQISSLGRVKSLARQEQMYSRRWNCIISRERKEKILKPTISVGYYRVVLMKNGIPKGCFIHRLIAQSFIPNPKNKPQVNHKNGIRTDFNIDNLEWVTISENHIHAWDILHRKRITGKEHKQSKAVIQMNLNGDELKKFGSIQEAARMINGKGTAIGRAARGMEKMGC